MFSFFQRKTSFFQPVVGQSGQFGLFLLIFLFAFVFQALQITFSFARVGGCHGTGVRCIDGQITIDHPCPFTKGFVPTTQHHGTNGRPCLKQVGQCMRSHSTAPAVHNDGGWGGGGGGSGGGSSGGGSSGGGSSGGGGGLGGGRGGGGGGRSGRSGHVCATQVCGH